MMESAFKKETVGLVTREQFAEKVSVPHHLTRVREGMRLGVRE